VTNVDQDNNRTRVYGSKTGEWRTVHYQPSLNQLLSIWIQEERVLFPDSPYLFSSNKTDKIAEATLFRVVRRAAERAAENEDWFEDDVIYETKAGKEKKRISPRAFRHGHAVHALKSGVDIRAVQKQLGHGLIETTMQYLRIVEDNVAEAYQAFGD